MTRRPARPYSTYEGESNESRYAIDGYSESGPFLGLRFPRTQRCWEQEHPEGRRSYDYTRASRLLQNSHVRLLRKFFFVLTLACMTVGTASRIDHIEGLVATLHEVESHLLLAELAIYRQRVRLSRLTKDEHSNSFVAQTHAQFDDFVALCAAKLAHIENELKLISDRSAGRAEWEPRPEFRPGIDFAFDPPAGPWDISLERI